jgi:hypothetical protein
MRMSLRLGALTTVASLCSLGLVTPAAHAVPASCLYPPSTPTLSIGLSTTSPVAGQPVYVKGRLRHNNCGVNGAATTITVGGRVVATKTTDTFGYYSYRFAPLAATTVSAASSYAGTPATAGPRSLSVRTNLRARFATARSCRVKVSGTTYPKKSGATIYVQRRVTKAGKFVGWRTAGSTRTRSTGAWAATVKLPCGSRVGLSAYIKATGGNAANRTPTVTVRVRR